MPRYRSKSRSRKSRSRKSRSRRSRKSSRRRSASRLYQQVMGQAMSASQSRMSLRDRLSRKIERLQQSIPLLNANQLIRLENDMNPYLVAPPSPFRAFR